MRALLPALLAVLPSCTQSGGITRALILRFEVEETIVSTDRIEVTVYDATAQGDVCEDVLEGPSAALAGLTLVAGPISTPLSQVSSIDLQRVPFGTRLFYVSARKADGDEIARGCSVADVLPSGGGVTVIMQRVPCEGEGALPCGTGAVCLDGECEDRACWTDGDPLALTDFTAVQGVGAQQVLPVRDGILAAWTGYVGLRRGAAVAHLSDDLEPIGATRIIEGEAGTWAALAPTSEGVILLWGEFGDDERAVLRTALLDEDGAPTGTEDRISLTYAGDYDNEDPAHWNMPGLLRMVPTSRGALAMWWENAAAGADPATGPWQVSFVTIAPDGTFAADPSRLDYPSAYVYETSPGTSDGAAIELVVSGSGECRLASIGADGRVISDDALTGPLESCATVAFGPIDGGYTFLGLETRRLTPWPTGDQTEPLLQPPDQPLAAALFGAFVRQPDLVYLGWEEHSADLLTSRINVALLDTNGEPLGPAVPLENLTGSGPYFGFAMTAKQDVLFAAWQDGPESSNRFVVSRIECEP